MVAEAQSVLSSRRKRRLGKHGHPRLIVVLAIHQCGIGKTEEAATVVRCRAFDECSRRGTAVETAV